MTRVLPLSALKGRVKRIPAVEAWLEERLHRRFLSREGYATYFGVFDSFAAARLSLPESPEFNSAEVIESFMSSKARRLQPYDYPVIFWLERAFRAGATGVFDIGGSVGVHFHAYRSILAYPEAVRWQVSEVPGAVAAGREIAARLGSRGLSFVDSIATTDVDAQVWLSTGALQYIEEGDLGRMLAQCPTPPTHIILNKLPVHDGDEFITTQNIGPGAFAPVRIYNRARFIEQVCAHGYRLVDSWSVPERRFYLPCHPDRCFPSFSGFCIEADSVAARTAPWQQYAASPAGEPGPH